MFNYILDKIDEAKILNYPFPHLDIENFLSDEHLNLIINNKQIHFDKMDTDDELRDKLIDNDWKIQGFPGCVGNWKKYQNYLKNKNYKSSQPVESVGITFRLCKYTDKVIEELVLFMNGDEFHDALRKKFNITRDTTIISAIQKNLTGYEISPHPDIIRKSLTYLLNINNNTDIEKEDCNTHLLEFKDEYKHVQYDWEKTKTRCWVPWDWCNTVKTMNRNNSMVIFKPDYNPPTLHAIRLNYDHLKYQRTQIYGNLMYKRV
jgi:hypothetical protein